MTTAVTIADATPVAHVPLFEVTILSRKDHHRLHECDLHKPMPYWECRRLLCGLRDAMPALRAKRAEFYLHIGPVSR